MKIRVLHVSHSAMLSGAEQALVRLIRAMDRTRFESLVVLPEDGPLRPALEEAGARTRVLPIRWWIPATHWSADEFASQFRGLEERWQDLVYLTGQERINLIHSNTIVTIEGALAATALGLPHVWHSRGSFGHGFPPAYADRLEFFFSVIDELAGHIVCVSTAVLKQTRHYIDRTPCSVVPDGFDLKPISASDIRRELDLPETARVVACIGGIQRRKGQLDLIDAMALVKRENPGAVLLLCGGAGDTQYVEEITRRIQQSELSSAVRLLGFRDDVASVIAHSSVIAHPSYSEGFPLAVLEAMAAGKPVVATYCGGPEDMIEDGVSGVLVNPGNASELAAAICRLLDDEPRAVRMGEAAQRRAERFTSQAYARGIEQTFTERLRSSGSISPDPVRATSVMLRVLAELDGFVRASHSAESTSFAAPHAPS